MTYLGYTLVVLGIMISMTGFSIAWTKTPEPVIQKMGKLVIDDFKVTDIEGCIITFKNCDMTKPAEVTMATNWSNCDIPQGYGNRASEIKS